MRRARSPVRSTASGAEAERGTALLGTLTGFAALLFFLLLATQVLVHLYATSVVTAATHDAARIVSGADGGPGSEDAAIAHAEALLGTWASDVSLRFLRTDDDAVVLEVRARSPALLPRTLNSLVGIGDIEREIVLRRERFHE